MQKKLAIIFTTILITFVVYGLISAFNYYYKMSDVLIDSIGEYNDIAIIISKEDYNHFLYNNNKYLNLVDSMFADTFHLNEPKYNIIWKVIDDIEDFNSSKIYSQIIFISIADVYDSTIDVIVDKLAKTNNINTMDILLLDNQFANKQQIFIARESNVVDLYDKLNNSINLVKNHINNHIEKLLLDNINSKKSNKNIQDKIKNRYGISIKIDNKYQILDSKENFFRIGMKTSNGTIKWLSIFKGGESDWDDIESIVNINKIILEDNISSKEINRDSSRYELVAFEIPDDIVDIEKYSNLFNITRNESIFIIDSYFNYDFTESRDPYSKDIISSNITGGRLITYVLRQNDNKHLFITGFVLNPNFNVGKYYYIKEFKALFNNIINGV